MGSIRTTISYGKRMGVWQPKKQIEALKAEVKSLKSEIIRLQQRIDAQERSMESCTCMKPRKSL